MQKLEKKQIEVIVAVVLVVVFLGILLRPKGKKVTRVYEKAAKGVEVVVGVLGNIATIQRDSVSVERRELVSVDAGSRDPFKILVRTTPLEPEPEPEPEPESEPEPEEEAAPEVIPPEVSIQGLLYQDKDPQSSIAIIGGDEKRIGDFIEDWRIETITEDRVVLRNGRQRHTIRLY